MFELGQLVKYRIWNWDNSTWSTDLFEIIEMNQVHIQYDDYSWEYSIKNLRTGEILVQVVDIQLQLT